MRNTNQLQSCGYDSCPCRGVNFISSGMGSIDYCVEGKRTRIKDGQPLPRVLFLYQLDKYAEYLKWRSSQQMRFGGYEPPVSPFDYTLAQEVAA